MDYVPSVVMIPFPQESYLALPRNPSSSLASSSLVVLRSFSLSPSIDEQNRSMQSLPREILELRKPIQSGDILESSIGWLCALVRNFPPQWTTVPTREGVSTVVLQARQPAPRALR
ncbi:hypothetical protein CABS01_00552 [Colletotrichum abscissum]|uniref:Uncharacterized protein n=1 Tax=Colletotrichum abscissum TaxID=1671311 RepID=A0A9Q0BA77_9PEZI|nr:uncharacterized protein CABS01_00552 [Colletotrichum abscissum]KAI3559458.1 hypothetical protein CABS02_00433 [Colletotrichum abscissum]KAK1525463.1 hypothetical protein CABS01_00552 [Colletotrichum abscissum]